jgi:hypothetical protein
MPEEMGITGEGNMTQTQTSTQNQSSGGQEPTTPNQGQQQQQGQPQPPGEEMIPKSRVQEIIRQRLAETRAKYQDYETLKGVVSQLEKLTGLTLDQLSQQLAAYEQQLVSRQVGVPPQILGQLDATQREALKAREESLNIRLDLEEERLKNSPLYADLKEDQEVRQAVREYAKRNGVSLEQAYWAVQGPKRVEQIKRETEQRVLADLKAKAAYGGVMGDSSEEIQKLGLTPEELSAARAMGMDPKEYAALKNVDNIEAYRSLKKKK